MKAFQIAQMLYSILLVTKNKVETISDPGIVEAPLAQSVERWTFDPTVKGSSPLWGVPRGVILL